ncbi:MAG: hypothetical protein AAGA29_02060 [Planctomycetota bacterium]
MAFINAGVFLLLCCAGLTLAIIALVSVFRGGQTRAVLTPAILGVLLNLGALSLFGLGVALAVNANRPTTPNDTWALYTDHANQFQIDLKGTPSKKLSTIGPSDQTFSISCVEAKSVNGRVLMSVEHIALPASLNLATDEAIITHFVEESLDHYKAQEMSRQVISTDDPRTIVRGTMSDPPGDIILVARRDGQSLFFLGYMANAHVVDEADASRFFDSFQRLEPTSTD